MSHLESFFTQLTWSTLESQMVAALRHPDREVPTRIQCPAVLDIANHIFSDIAKDALARPGQDLRSQDIFSHDQKLAVLRLLEAIIVAAEQFLEASGTDPVRRLAVAAESTGRQLDSPIMKALEHEHR